MLWEKNQKKEVFFTEEAADKQLLAAIEKELNTQKYQTFSNLCKQALWQFLYVSLSTEIAQSASNLQRLEHRIYEKLNQHFSELEKTIASSELNESNQITESNESNQIAELDEMKKHLSQMNQQLTQMQLSFNAKFVEVLQSFKAELPKIEAAIDKYRREKPIYQTIQEPELTRTKTTETDLPDETSITEVETSITESDPVLQHLSSLIEDF
ncbi:hypothetical protein [Okeania sp.]|uniref:hypothetical protein n=1 Tax=Okeania sp. TaxID=3100323 RepID=UPI002B4B2DC8|nr:hypothetical protein [Okeania sp.]MEB3341517.1 hypothetical protein [Okeania sp.]